MMMRMDENEDEEEDDVDDGQNKVLHGQYQ